MRSISLLDRLLKVLTYLSLIELSVNIMNIHKQCVPSVMRERNTSFFLVLLGKKSKIGLVSELFSEREINCRISNLAVQKENCP